MLVLGEISDLFRKVAMMLVPLLLLTMRVGLVVQSEHLSIVVVWLAT